MKKQTVVDQIEITRNGTIQLRIAKELVDDDGTILTSSWHRTSLPPGHDIDAQMAAVNAHLTQGLGFPSVSASDIDRVKTLAAPAWTDDVVQAYLDEVAKSLPPELTPASAEETS